jgi:putative endonuclease
MYIVYILESLKTGRFYIGYSEDPERRLYDHNVGKVKSTRLYRPWRKVYQESFSTKLQAMRRERSIKAMKSRSYIFKLIGRHVPTESRDGQ